MAKNYTIDGKKVYATVKKLSAADLKEIKNYLALGYELVDVEPKKITKEEKAAAAAANPYSKQNVEAFLKKDENKALFEEYKARYNEQAGTNRKGKPDEPKFLKSGKPKVKGYANCIGWFTDRFTWDEDKKTYIAK